MVMVMYSCIHGIKVCLHLFPLKATASTINAVLMRQHEFKEGIEVNDEKGNPVGVSCIAAKRVCQLLLCAINTS